MEVQLTEDQRAFARQAIASGRLRREEQAVEEALELWEDRERRRASLLANLDQADASLQRGQGRVITEASMGELAQAVKDRGRAKLAVEQASSDD